MRLQDLMALRNVLVGRERLVLIPVRLGSGTIVWIMARRRRMFPGVIFCELSREISQAEVAWLHEGCVCKLRQFLRRQYLLEDSEYHPHRYFKLKVAFRMERQAPSQVLSRVGYLLDEFDLVSTRS
jgi:hypothetical protein